MEKVVILLLGLIILTSCSRESDYVFYDVDLLNSQLIQETGLDISQLKENADSVFKIDDQYYLNLIEEMSDGQNSNSFKRANIPEAPIEINGYIFFKVNEYDSIAQIMMKCFADNILTQNCDAQSKDLLCQEKVNWKAYMSGDREAQLHYGFFFSGLMDLYEKNYLSQEEFHYLILYLHYLGVLTDNSIK